MSNKLPNNDVRKKEHYTLVQTNDIYSTFEMNRVKEVMDGFFFKPQNFNSRIKRRLNQIQFWATSQWGHWKQWKHWNYMQY